MDVPQSYLDRIREYLPDVPMLTTHFNRDGLMNDVIVLNDTMVIRFTKDEQARTTLTRERAILDLVRRYVQLPTPHVDRLEDGVMIYRFIPGAPLVQDVLLRLDSARQDRMAEQLALFLRQLHRIPPEVVAQHGIGTSAAARVQEDWEWLFGAVERDLFPHLWNHTRAWVRRLFAPVLTGELSMAYEPTLIHGDLAGYHLLHDPAQGVLTGVLRLLEPAVERQRAAFVREPSARAGDSRQSTRREVRELANSYRMLDQVFGTHVSDQIASSLTTALGLGSLNVDRARAAGLSAPDLTAWCASVREALEPETRLQLLRYVADCRLWDVCLDGVIGGIGDPDWDMTSARRVVPSAPEAQLAAALQRAGLPLQCQVGVSQFGGPRKGGWFNAFWLDCAHRDVAFLLRIDIELDGITHSAVERRVRDSVRNTLLAHRGWYVFRFDARLLRQTEALERAVRSVLSLARRHRRAVVLARTDISNIAAELELSSGESQSLIDDADRRLAATRIALRRQIEQAQIAMLMGEII